MKVIHPITVKISDYNLITTETSVLLLLKEDSEISIWLKTLANKIKISKKNSEFTLKNVEPKSGKNIVTSTNATSLLKKIIKNGISKIVNQKKTTFHTIDLNNF